MAEAPHDRAPSPVSLGETANQCLPPTRLGHRTHGWSKAPTASGRGRGGARDPVSIGAPQPFL